MWGNFTVNKVKRVEKTILEVEQDFLEPITKDRNMEKIIEFKKKSRSCNNQKMEM